MSTNRNREEFGPVTRNRSSSANEASKPILVTQRRQTHVGSKTLNFSPSNGSVVAGKFWHNYFPLEYQRSTIFLTSFDTDFRIEVHKHTQKKHKYTNTQYNKHPHTYTLPKCQKSHRNTNNTLSNKQLFRSFSFLFWFSSIFMIRFCSF